MASGNKLDRFTQRARRVLSNAQDQAERLRNDFINPGHMLIGMVMETEGVGGRVLAGYGFRVRRVEYLVEKMIEEAIGLEGARRLDLDTTIKRLLEGAVDEARRMGHHYIGTEHLLLALVGQNDPLVSRVLDHYSIPPADIRQAVLTAVREAQAQQQATPAPQAPTSTGSRFTADAQRVLGLAQAAAERHQHQDVGTAHLFLGLFQVGVAGQILATTGLTVEQIDAVVAEVGAPNDPNQTMDLSAGVKHTLEQAVTEARQLNQSTLDSTHLLLGLLNRPDDEINGLLGRLGLERLKLLIATLEQVQS